MTGVLNNDGSQLRIQDFPEDGAPTPKNGFYYLTKLYRKLHENEENLAERGAPDPPIKFFLFSYRNSLNSSDKMREIIPKMKKKCRDSVGFEPLPPPTSD